MGQNLFFFKNFTNFEISSLSLVSASLGPIAQLFRWEMKFSKIVNYGNLTFLMVALLKCICFYFELFINENKHCGDD